MNDTLRIARILLGCALAIFAAACDDSAGNNPTDPETDDGTVDPGDMDMGPDEGMSTTACLRDDQCAPEQYCQPAPAGGLGSCVEGCRTGDADNCPDGELCDGATRLCVPEPCGVDQDCADGEYCAEGTCTAGCREGEGCSELDEQGRGQTCDLESRMCASLFPCCMADMCSASLPAACEAGGGEVIDAVATCDANPCGPDCTTDDECPDQQYCNTEDGRCADGCRVDDPYLCLPSEFCDPDKHTCEIQRCLDDEECPEDRYCDTAEQVCVLGCREDPDNCPEGEQCIENVCEQRCDVRAGPDEPGGCPAGSYCDPLLFNCLEECFEHGDCDPLSDRFCDADSNRCVPGCRDDEGELGEPNNDIGTATPIDLRPVPGGGRTGEADGRVICGNDPDFYAVELEAGERLRIDLTYDRDGGNLDLRLHGDEVVDGPIEVATLEVPERLEYPPLGELVQRPTTYYIEVFPPGNDPARRLEYRITVSVVDAAAPCFPDDAEPADNDREGATPVGVRGGVFGGRSLCPGNDVDHFRLNLNPNDGLQVGLLFEPPDARVEAYLYPANRQAQAAPYRLNAANNYQFRAALNDGAFAPQGEWFIQVRGLDADTIVEPYELSIVRESAATCGTDDDTEPNDTLAQGVRLPDVAIDAVTEVDLDTAICTVDDPDVDVFCFAAEMGETLEAWTVSPAAAVNGELAVQFLDARGVVTGVAGRGVEQGEMTRPARVVNATPGNYCVRVSGIDGAQGPYRLSVQRLSPAMGICANDVAEVGGRNDRATAATPLVDVTGDGRRYEYLQGYICDGEAGVDFDWYSFDVGQPGSSLCVMIDDFDRTRADVDLDIYPGTGDDVGANCQRDDQCGGAARAACIERRCTTPLDVSVNQRFDFEMINLRRPFLGPRSGEFLLRVGHDDPNEGPYNVTVTVTPTEAECGPDWQEIEGANDAEVDATFLGAGQVAICDTWICRSERRDGDWYAIDVPAEQDRTVIINYSGGVEGRLVLSALGPDQPGDPGSGAGIGSLSAGNHQCVNLRGGDMASPVLLQVTAPSFEDDQRIDYSLRVVPTDLDANPEGECENLGAADFDACPPRDEWPDLPPFGRIQPEDCWVTIEMP